MERFLRYSLSHGRPIRLIYQETDGRMRQVTATVTALGEDGVELVTLRPRRTVSLPWERLLSADYRRGDEGKD